MTSLDYARRLACEGEFKRAKTVLEHLLREESSDEVRKVIEYELEWLRRVRYEYSVSERRARELLSTRIIGVTEREIRRWLDTGALDARRIDGRLRFFQKFLDNLVFAEPQLKRRLKPQKRKEPNLLKESIERIATGDVHRYRVRAGIRIKLSKKLPDEKFRVWLPVPREGYQIENVRIIRAAPADYYVSDAPQRTVYFESTSREYSVEFEYDISEVKDGIEGTNSGNLGEKEPHIMLTPFIKRLAREIVGDAETDAEKARRIYRWVTTGMHYFYVRNYGTYSNIGEYAALNRRGDCGFHAILFITLCRAVGIPAKWQSGWFVTPHYAGPHDWAQVFLDGKWYPVDASFGNLNRHGKLENEFYFGSMDAFRMIANDDLLTRFDPPKRHWRSDPVDNQVGEVETESGNVYYDRYSWKIYLREFQRV